MTDSVVEPDAPAEDGPLHHAAEPHPDLLAGEEVEYDLTEEDDSE